MQDIVFPDIYRIAKDLLNSNSPIIVWEWWK
jgi:hypothetical protein